MSLLKPLKSKRSLLLKLVTSAEQREMLEKVMDLLCFLGGLDQHLDEDLG